MLVRVCVSVLPLPDILPLPLPSASAFVLGQCDLLAVHLFLSIVMKSTCRYDNIHESSDADHKIG